MGAKAASQFPYSFDMIQIWAIRGQEVELHGMAVVGEPRLDVLGMMPTCVIGDNKHHAAFSSMTQELF